MFITTRDAAARLGITPQAVRMAIKRGRLRARKFGRDNLIEEADLQAYLSTRRRRLSGPDRHENGAGLT